MLGRHFQVVKYLKKQGKKGSCLNKGVWVLYLGLVGELHQMVHEGSGLRVLRITHLLYLQVSLCAKNSRTSAWMILMAECSAVQRTHCEPAEACWEIKH